LAFKKNPSDFSAEKAKKPPPLEKMGGAFGTG